MLSWYNSTFKKSSFWKTRLLNCRVFEPLSRQHISEDITRPFRNRVFNLTRPLEYRVIIDYPNMRAHAHVCLFQLHCPGSEKGKLSLLESEQVRLQSWRFPPDNFILIIEHMNTHTHTHTHTHIYINKHTYQFQWWWYMHSSITRSQIHL